VTVDGTEPSGRLPPATCGTRATGVGTATGGGATTEEDTTDGDAVTGADTAMAGRR